jgi:hypothetical protein
VSVELFLELEALPFERAEAELAAAAFFADERPLRGAAGRADWRLCGQVSELLLAGRATGAPGEAILLSSQSRLRAPRLLLLGLGQRADFEPAAVGRAAAQLVRRACGLGARSLLLAPPGVAPHDLPIHADPFLAGVLAALSSASGALRLRLALAEGDLGPAARALAAAARTLDCGPVRLHLPSPDAPGSPAGKAQRRTTGDGRTVPADFPRY